MDVRLSSHEAVCAERYKNLETGFIGVREEVVVIKNTMWAVTGAVMLQLLTLIGYLLTRGA